MVVEAQTAGKESQAARTEMAPGGSIGREQRVLLPKSTRADDPRIFDPWL